VAYTGTDAGVLASDLNFTDTALYSDGIAANDTGGVYNNDTITIVFTGLDSSLTYDLAGGTSRSANTANFDTSWIISGETTIDSDATATGGYVSFTGLTVVDSGDGTGTLTITIDDIGTQHAEVTQLTLEAIPEPATIGMVLAAAGGLLFVRRRIRR
jgi:hypothetical protein